MFVHGITVEDGGFTRVTLSGIEERAGACPEVRRTQMLLEQAGNAFPSGFFSRVLDRADMLVLSVRSSNVPELGAAALGRAHDAVCAVFGPQPLEFLDDGVPQVREPDGGVHFPELIDLREAATAHLI
jgi:hypothetical protein